MSEVERQADHARRAARNNSKEREGIFFVCFYPMQVLEKDSAEEQEGGTEGGGVVSVQIES